MASKDETKRVYRIQFLNQGKLYEVYARGVSQGHLFGFIEIEELIFGARSEVVLDPSEESLKTEFAGVKRFYVPMHAVIRIDEVESRGTSRITEVKEGGKVSPFPVPLYPPPGGDSGK